MLERMDLFFDARLEGYDAHQLEAIEGAAEFYTFTAQCLPERAGCRVLDLGCGTGLELEAYFARNPTAAVTGIDLAPGMLGALRAKFPNQDITLIQGSYFTVPLGTDRYDAAVSVESLHHFTQAEKAGLYRRVWAALKPGGYLVLTDYFAPSDALEQQYRQELKALRVQQSLPDDQFYHYDTPLTVAHELEALSDGGFSAVQVLRQWSTTATIVAVK